MGRCGFAEGLHRVTLLGVGAPRAKTLESDLEDESVRGKAREPRIWKQGRPRVPGTSQGCSVAGVQTSVGP